MPKVKSFQPAGEGYPAWWLLEVEGEEAPLLVHDNAIHDHIREIGMLEPGDEVKFEKTKLTVYRGSPFHAALNLARAPKQALVA